MKAVDDDRNFRSGQPSCAGLAVTSTEQLTMNEVREFQIPVRVTTAGDLRQSSTSSVRRCRRIDSMRDVTDVHRVSSSGTSCCFSNVIPVGDSSLPRIFVVNARSLVKK